MKLTLHQLKVFEKVAQLGSITEAARNLHMTQPAVSNILKQLESYYGCSLTEVISKKLYLTSFGEEVLNLSLQIRENLNNAHMRLEMMKGGTTGSMSVSTVSTAKYFVPHLLGQFRRSYPEVQISMKVYNRQEIISRLQANKDDFVIMSQPPTTFPVECADFYEDQLVVIAAVDHPLVKTRAMSLKNLQNESWIMREEGSGTRIAMLEIFRKNHCHPKIEMEIGNNEAIKQAVIAGMGISIVSKQSIKAELKAKLLTILDVKSFPIRHEWYLVKNSGKQLSPIAEKFYAFVTQHKPRFSEFHR